MKVLAFLIFLFINYILKAAILPNFLPINFIFNMTLCLVVSLALLAKSREGLIWTIVVAVLNDLLAHEVLFLNLFLFTIVYLLIYFIRDNINMENLLSIAIVNIVVYLFYITFSYILLSFMSVNIGIAQLAKNIFSIKIVFVALYGVLSYLISKRIFRYKNYDI
ncbi:hypothetical protein [Fenollaria massiliensis]|uniref:Rod shape-determining protein MreD n=1 Tax=Fenollaria massiliensis TaxID=938288 RepID=A0A9E7DII6_9FIRM|nr:hypothetical protein [Fenollaria massiliensis]UQK58551.1 hypothetical protein M1R53_04745 [Fenollaria massiliensis]